MRAVDEAIFARIEAAGMWASGLHDQDGTEKPAGVMAVFDGFADFDTDDKVVRHELPYAVYYSSLGDDPPTDANERLTGQRGRRSVFFSITYVGGDNRQTKWAGQKLRDAIAGKRLTVPTHRVWLVSVEESQRIRRDDEAVRPDGTPLFYGVDNYAVSITLNPNGSS